MSVRIGINPLSWSNDDMPELGADTPLEICLAEGKQAGYAGFELGRKFPRDPELLALMLETHNLALVSGWYGSQLLTRDLDAEIEAVDNHLSLLRRMGCAVMVFAEVSGSVHQQRDMPLSQRPVMKPAQWNLFVDRLSGMARYLHDNGVRMAYHHHMGTVVETKDEIDQLMAETDSSVGLLLDTGHLTYVGGDPVQILRQHAGRVVHVHCKDVRSAVLRQARESNSSFLDAVLDGVFTVPGDGCIDFLAVARELKSQKYSGWLVVEAEQNPAKANPLVYATKGYRYLDEVVAASGL